MNSLLAASLILGLALGAEPDPADHLMGERPPPFDITVWLNTEEGEPLTLGALRGRVVLVRFWTNTCPYCAATAPALARLHRLYADQGLLVVGLYHPKPPRPISRAELERFAKRLGMTFPVGLDADWRTLKAWYLEPVPDSRATSVSFLLDRAGRLRHIDPGPEFHPGGGDGHEVCRQRYDALQRVLRTLLEG